MFSGINCIVRVEIEMKSRWVVRNLMFQMQSP